MVLPSSLAERAGNIGFRRSSLTDGASLTRSRGLFRAESQILSDRPADGAERLLTRLGRLRGTVSEPFDRHPWFFWFTSGGRIPPGCCPSSLSLDSCKQDRGEIGVSLVYEVDPIFPREVPAKSGRPHLAAFPFSRFSATPFFSRLRAARVCFLRWLPHASGREPFEDASSELPKESVSASPHPFHGLPRGGGFPSESVSSSRIASACFQAADLSRHRSPRASHFPCTLLK